MHCNAMQTRWTWTRPGATGLRNALTRFNQLPASTALTPREIAALHAKLASELDEIQNADERGQQLQEAVTRQRERTSTILAQSLSTDRQAAAERFSAAVSEAMQGLGMPGGQFEVKIAQTGGD